MRRRSPISNSAYPICWSAWKPPTTVPPRPTVDLGRVEEGLHDILRSLERQHASLVALAETNRNSGDTAQPMDSGIVDLVKRELSDIRFSQSETDRRTQDSLETVHSTLGHVVDRLSTIEGDLRTVRAAPAAAQSSLPRSKCRRDRASDDAAASTPPPLMQPGRRNRNRNCRIPPRCRGTLKNILPPRRANSTPRSRRRRSPRHCRRARSAKSWSRMPPRRAPRSRRNCRRIIRSSRARGRPARMSSPSERIAASENAISEIASGPKEPVSSSSFIAAARRAAQAAAAAPPPEKAGTLGKGRAQGQGRRQGQGSDKADDKTPSNMSSKIRSLLVGASVVVIVLGTFKMAMTLLDTGSVLQLPMMEQSSEPAAPAQAPAPAENIPSRQCPRRLQPAAHDDFADAGREAVEQFFRAEHAG